MYLQPAFQETQEHGGETTYKISVGFEKCPYRAGNISLITDTLSIRHRQPHVGKPMWCEGSLHCTVEAIQRN